MASYFGCISNENSESTLIEALNASLEMYFNYRTTDQSFKTDLKFCDKFKQSTEYSFSLIKRDVPQIVSHKSYFVNEGIFSEDEICTFEYFLDEITTIANTSVIFDLGEYLKILFTEAIKIEEIKKAISVRVVFKRNNSFEIVKEEKSDKNK